MSVQVYVHPLYKLYESVQYRSIPYIDPVPVPVLEDVSEERMRRRRAATDGDGMTALLLGLEFIARFLAVDMGDADARPSLDRGKWLKGLAEQGSSESQGGEGQ